jgi:hypothetical protein
MPANWGWIGFMSRRVVFSVVLALAGLTGVMLVGLVFAALTVLPAHAGDEGPVIVIPSRPGIPVVINGVDASYAVVEGDWGLARPGAVAVTVYGGSPLYPNPVYSRRNSYHPKYGHAPPRGRMEVEPPADRALPDPAESFSRSWSTSSDVQQTSDRPKPQPYHSETYDPAGSDMPPATITDPATYPQNLPPVIIDPRGRRR